MIACPRCGGSLLTDREQKGVLRCLSCSRPFVDAFGELRQLVREAEFSGPQEPQKQTQRRHGHGGKWW